MRKLILSEWVSLDGSIAERNGQLDFFAGLVRKTNAEADQVRFLDTFDTILLGRKTYEQFVQVWPDRPTGTEALAEKMNTTKKVVLSNTLASAPWGKWQEAEIAGGNPVSAVRQLKALPGKDIILWASISVGQTLMKEKLIDEFQLFLCPAIAPGGRKLFPENMDPASLRLVGINHYDTGVVCLHYQHSINR